MTTNGLSPAPADTQCPDCHNEGTAPANWPTERYFRCYTPDCAAIAYFVWLAQ